MTGNRYTTAHRLPGSGDPRIPVRGDRTFEAFDFDSVTAGAADIENLWNKDHPGTPLHRDALIHHLLAHVNAALPEGLSIESPDATHITGDSAGRPSRWREAVWEAYMLPEEVLAPGWDWEKYMSTFTREHVDAWQAKGNHGYPPHPWIAP